MSVADTVGVAQGLEAFGNVVPVGYTYAQKQVAPRANLSLPEAYLKWYDIHLPESPIASEQLAEARAFVAAEAERLGLAQELGFVLLHRAGPVLLLLLVTWRNTNELWESVYLRELDGAGGYRPLEFAGSHRGTYCVWELGPIWHERDAWRRFLSSERDAAAKRAYLDDKFAGLV